MEAEQILDRLYELLGEAVLLTIPLGEKGPTEPGWQELTFEQTRNRHPDLLEAVDRGGNLGVLLGPKSNRLLALDLDDDELVGQWLSRFPWLAETLRSKGKRGCQFWLRLEDGCDYPNGKAVYKLTEGGYVLGELRLGGASGAQSVIFGVHPDGMDYQIEVEKPPRVVSLADLDELAPGLIFNDHQAESGSEPLSRPSLATNILKRVECYIDTCDPAISGQRGHDTTFRVLCSVIGGFDLSAEEAWHAARYYNFRCEPPWSEKELRHKVEDALKATATEPRGHLLHDTQFNPTLQPKTLTEQLEKERAEAEQAANGELAGAKAEPSKSALSKKPHLILPSGEVSIIESATFLFKQLAKTRRYFARGRLVVEVVRNKEGNEVLAPLRATAFRSRMEKDFRLLTWRSLRAERVIKPAHCPKDIAEAFLESEPAIDCLPGIVLLVSSPILAEHTGSLIVLNKGYHDVNGGIYVEKRIDIIELQLKEATKSLLALLDDFDFTTGSDKSRAIASFISPALRFGSLVNADFPLDLAEADESQSGKTYRQKIACAIYGEKPYVIARRENGVGSLDESISCALLSGRPFICFENVRGIMDSQILESAIRGHGHVNVRVPHRGEVQLSTERVCWQLSSNQAATTRDLANRSLITRIRKRPAGYQYQAFSEGDLLTHVQRNCGYYLSCVFSVVEAWFKAGKPKTTDSSHDFREWSQALDWIVQNLFGLPPLLAGHREEQQRISDPHLNWLRDVAIAVSHSGKLNEGLRPGELVDLAASRGVVVPGYGHQTNEDQQTMLAGRILNKVFSDNKVVTVGGFQVRHDQRNEHDYERRRVVTRHYYWFEILAEKCASCAPCASS